MNEAQALQYVSDPNVASADAAYESLVPAGACVGAVLSSSEPSYLLWGRNRRGASSISRRRVCCRKL